MCMQCVAQGAPYVLGSVAMLRVMGARAGRRRRASPGEAPPQVDAELEVDDAAAPQAGAPTS